jgi:N-acyl-D-amino-acid deacylase
MPPAARPAYSRLRLAVLPVALVLAACTQTTQGPSADVAKSYDVILRHGTIYDGSGSKPFVGDVAITGDSIAAIGAPRLEHARGAVEVDVSGLAVAPGFINMLSHAEESLIEDGRGQSDIRQGVTLEVFGEFSMGPLNDQMKRDWKKLQSQVRYDYVWSTLGGYLDWLTKRGVSPNIASFVGAGTVREYVVGLDDKRATPAEVAAMRALIKQAMCEGAMGLSTALIYPPDTYSTTGELIELSKAAAEGGGMFTVHIRNEGHRVEEAIDEVLTIARDARIPAEIYHLKLAGKDNWGKLDGVIRKIEAARAEGLRITTDMYTYVAGATGFDAAMPKWVQAGGYEAWAARLKDPEVRERVKKEMADAKAPWDNLYAAAGPEKIMLVSFKNPSLRPLTGKTLAEVAKTRGRSPEDTVMDLVIEDGTRVGVVYFLMSEENVRRQVALPWMSFNSDAEALAPEGVFLTANPHPRAYGSFARLLGKYVRDEGALPLEEAIRRLTSFPAQTLGITRRGALSMGSYADVVAFDPKKIADHATFDAPHKYSTGVVHVFVNGVQVLKDGEHTGAKPGRVVRGKGARPGDPCALEQAK